MYEHISFYKEDGTLNMLASPHYTTQILKEYGLLQENKDQNLRSMKIYASDVLCPKNFRTGKYMNRIEQFQFIILLLLG